MIRNAMFCSFAVLALCSGCSEQQQSSSTSESGSMISLAFSRSADTKSGTTAKGKQKSGGATSLPRKAKQSAAEANSTTTIGADESPTTLTAEEKSTLATAYKIYRDVDFEKAAETIKELESKLSVPAVAALDLRLKFIEQSSAALNRCYAEVESGDKNTAIEKVLHFYWKQDDELSTIWNDQTQSAEMCEMLGECFNDVYSLPIRFIGEKNASQEALVKARACFKRCLELDDTNAVAHTRLAFAAFKNEGIDSSDLMEHLIKALENSPERARLILSLDGGCRITGAEGCSHEQNQKGPKELKRQGEKRMAESLCRGVEIVP